LETGTLGDMPSLPTRTLDWVAEQLGEPVIVVEEFTAAWTRTVLGLRAGERELVLCAYTNPDVIALDPGAVAREAAALGIAAPAGLPAPELLVYDIDGVAAGVPALVTSRLPGRPVTGRDDPDRFIAELVDLFVAVAITTPDASGVLDPYRPWVALDHLHAPAWSSVPAAWQEAARRLRRWTPPTATTLAHRDLHPGNILWHDGVVTGVVDWPNACLAPTAMDVGKCMSDLSILHDPDAAWRFHDGYAARRDEPIDIEWILIGAFELTMDEVDAAEIIGWTGEPDLIHDTTHVRRRLDEHVTAAVDRAGHTAKRPS
jgi:aminoglycoside phosphotransferase (APT) family kinase protein